MSCERAVIVKSQPSSSFGVKETLGGMAVGLLLLGAGTMDLTLAGPKWSYGDCNCGDRPTLASSISFAAPRRADFAPALRAAQAPEAPASAGYAASPLPVPAPEMAGAQVGAEPQAHLALQAFPQADLYRADEGQPQQGGMAGPRVNYDWRTTGAGAGDPNVGRVFADAPGLDDSGDALMPARR